MNKIPTASEKLMDLKTYFKSCVTSDGKKALNGFALWKDIPQVMIEFAKLHIQAALKAVHKNQQLPIEDWKLTLNAYPLTNIT